MKKLKRILSFVLVLTLTLTFLPPLLPARAAEVIQRYELETDGIEPGATYLIVNSGVAGEANALRFYYASWWSRDLRNQQLTVQQAEDGTKYIDIGFTNEDSCQFQFSATGAGQITHGDYAVDLENAEFTSGDPERTLTFSSLGGGAYQIYYTRYWWNYYLRYSDSDWAASTTSSTVYLYKLTETVVGYDVTYNGNGHTSGSLPANATELSYGESYTLEAPTDLRKDIGEDTWLFQCWNTASDGSGTEYAPGETITVTQDTTLYAQWYQQTKYTLSMITYLDGVATDVDTISGHDKPFFAQLEGGDGSYIPLNRAEEGTYSAKVPDNGTYVIYTLLDDGSYDPVHGHKVVIYNQDGVTECMHYSLTVDANGGTWAEGQEPQAQRVHYGEAVTAPEGIPTLEGNRFLGWLDQDGKLIQPGQTVTESADRKLTLTAQWEKTVSVTVNVTIDHKPTSSGSDNSDTKDNVTFQVMRTDEAGYNHLVQTFTLSSDSHQGYTYSFDAANDVTTYTVPEGQVTLGDLQKGTYTATASKRMYLVETQTQTDSEGNVTVQLRLAYDPSNFDLDFDVVVADWENVPESLRPQAVNIKVTYWGYNEAGVLGWHIITQQEGENPPTTVAIDPATGTGSGFYPVWKYWSTDDGENHPYFYRVAVSSYVMPDGAVAPATETEGKIYTAGIYSGTVEILPDAGTPDYPDGSQTSLKGTIYEDARQLQDSTPTLTVQVNPFTVTFHAQPGTVHGQQTLVLEEQFRYPDLSNYQAVPAEADKVFVCWCDENGQPVENLAGQLLTGSVSYYARYNENIVISGDVSVAATYLQDGEVVKIPETDREEELLVVLQKKVGDVYNDMDSVLVPITYAEDADGQGSYQFKDIPNDGTEYRIQILTLNYQGAYDNNADGTYSEQEAVAIIDDATASAQVDIRLELVPETYQQAIRVDASQIAQELRPTGALVQILYRDLGDVHHYQVVSQHTVEPFGITVDMSQETAEGLGFEDVWNWHTNGSLYEYQVQVYKMYGKNLEGAYSEEGVEYTDACPYTIEYGPSNNYLQQMYQGGAMLEATLVPKEYPVVLDVNLGEDTETPVLGLEDYMVDDGTGNDRYVYLHTWSHSDHFSAFPYREGYVFKGWTTTNTDDVLIENDGLVHVGATLANSVTLTAQWEKLSGTDYTIRHLELNTDKVLYGAQAIRGAAVNDAVVAADKVLSIDGYVYAGAMVNGSYMDKTENPVMTVTEDPAQNLMVIYYLPDGSDGYTEQVESNLEISKTAVLEDNGTYTITMDTYTRDNPITTLIQQNTPLDIVLVLDQSGSLAANNYEYLNALQDAVDSFVESVADHGRRNEVDHRIALVGYAGNATDGHSSEPIKATGGKETDSWINTGVFDASGEFHLYDVTGFTYTPLTDTTTITADGIYFAKSTVEGQDTYLLLTHHDEYRHLITEEEARVALLQGETVFGFVYDEYGAGSFVELTRNSSGLWLYGDKQLYSLEEFFTYHTDVWTHRDGLNPRQIHAYGVGSAYTTVDGHEGVYTRAEVTDSSFTQSIYQDALMPVSVGANGSGGTNQNLLAATQSLGADGATRASYGMEMANSILAANPLDDGEDRVRLVLMFTDGEPGYLGFDDSSGSDYYEQAVTEANDAIAQAYITKNTHNAYVYTIGLYESAGVEATSDVAYYMNALSSNYPQAQSMDDIKAEVSYVVAEDGTALEDNGKYYVNYNGTYYVVEYGYVRVSGRNRYCWYFRRGNSYTSISTTTYPTVSNGRVGSYTIYTQTGGYMATDHSGYYTTTEDSSYLKEYFENVLKDITTRITTEIILESDTILRDIMNQGLVLTDGTVITAYTQEGTFDVDTGEINWAENTDGTPLLEEKVSLTIGSGQTTAKDEESGVTINVYNLGQENATDPNGENYHPHTVDVTGYDFHNWYICAEKPVGYKMVVTITRVEATDDVEWGKSTNTNEEQSGLWLPADENGQRQLLLPFDQPSTIFVERAYVLDYGKEFTLSGWYFDDEDGKEANPVHVDCNIADGMNWFDEASPNTANALDGAYGNIDYGNVKIADGQVSYTPTGMSWGGHDQFYVFGNTWRKTVLAQEANANGNLWNKVTVIPANNIYYEDSFVTTQSTTQNGIEGFTFTGAWDVVSQEGAGSNTEVPEHMEDSLYGDVHGWTDSLGDDTQYTDGSAHVTGQNGEMGAQVEFTFTGTGVDIYTTTNASSGMVVAVLNRKLTAENGTVTTQFVKSLAIDNLAMSGEYYHIPTVSFRDLVYGTYTVRLIATAASDGATGEKRFEYCLDGVRVYNPLGNTTNYADATVRDAYGLETNAVFTQIRDILLDYGDFNVDMPDDTVLGAVFIDWIQEGQGSGEDSAGTGQPTYQLGTFESYGPKNEVYLGAGQAIVLKVDPTNTYFVGMKSPSGKAVTVNVSGIDQEDPTQIQLMHTTDMYYQVTPVDGYIVIQNGSADATMLSLTTLRTTNLTAPAEKGGILPVAEQEAVALMATFSAYLAEPEDPEETPPEETPDTTPSAQEQAEQTQAMAATLFTSVRQWLDA